MGLARFDQPNHIIQRPETVSIPAAIAGEVRWP
jgi:hypothetical protein